MTTKTKTPARKPQAAKQAPAPKQPARKPGKYAPDLVIKVLRTDMKPKRNKRNPYAIYADGMTVGAALAAGIKKADLWWDTKHTKAIEIVGS